MSRQLPVKLVAMPLTIGVALLLLNVDLSQADSGDDNGGAVNHTAPQRSVACKKRKYLCDYLKQLIAI